MTSGGLPPVWTASANMTHDADSQFRPLCAHFARRRSTERPRAHVSDCIPFPVRRRQGLAEPGSRKDRHRQFRERRQQRHGSRAYCQCAPAGWSQAGCPPARGVSVSRRTAAGRPEGAESKACRFPGVASLAPARSPTPWQAGFSCRCNSCTTYRSWSRDTVARTVLARTATMALAYGQAPGRGLPGAANCG